MSRLIKWILGLFGLFIALVLLAALAVMVLIDPNDYREQIANTVKQDTGRELHIEGELNLSFFPWLGLELGQLSLGNAEGFADEPFAAIRRADLRVKLLPLLRMQTEIDTIALHGLTLNLHCLDDGRCNWDDLAEEKKPASAATDAPTDKQDRQPSSDQMLAGLAIGGIEILDANIRWQDDVSGQLVTLRNFNLQTGAIRMDQAIDLQMNAELGLKEPELQARMELATRITLDPAAQRYRLDATRLSLDAQSPLIPGEQLSLTLRADLAADLEQQTAHINQLLLQTMGIDLSMQLAVQELLDGPRFSGKLSTNEFVPRQLMDKLDIELPEMADPNTLILAKLAMNFEGGLDHAAITDLQMQLDQSRVSGQLSLRNPESPVIRYQLALDDIDLDRYLPPASEDAGPDTPAATTATAGTEATASELPLETLRSLDIDGTIRIGKFKVMNLHSDSIVKTLRAEKGLFRVHPLTANMYQGSYSGDLRFDVRQTTPKLGMDEQLSGVQAGPLLKDFLGEDYASGKTNLSVKLTAEGLDPAQVRRTLNGNGQFSFEDGQVKGINIGHVIRQAYALYKQQPAPAEESRQTDFTALRGSFTVRNGLLNTRDLNARSPLFQIDGQGDVNLVSEKLDLRFDTTIVGSLKDAANQELDELKGQKLPITVKGSFSNPKIGLDLESVLRARVQQAVDKKKEEVRDKAEERIDEEKKKLEQQLKDRLKLRF